jgi:thiamine biosynthesis lipoprotein
LGILSTSDRAVITSGGYERYFEQDGVTYHHIIDPKTGYPAESGLVSVTIISADGTLADGLSTSLFVMGKDRAVDYWENHREEFDMILLSEDGTLYVSEGIEDSFSSDYDIEVIR